MIWIAAARDPQPAKEREAPSPWLVDEFVESYVRWREESAVARSAYEAYAGQKGADRALAFTAYHAALDREERAARVYQECAERISARKQAERLSQRTG
jgi:hypothetical protein